MRSQAILHFFRSPIHWAHRAVIFATARLSCFHNVELRSNARPAVAATEFLHSIPDNQPLDHPSLPQWGACQPCRSAISADCAALTRQLSAPTTKKATSRRYDAHPRFRHFTCTQYRVPDRQTHILLFTCYSYSSDLVNA